MFKPFPDKKYKIIYADPPWEHYGDPNKNAAAGKHYDLIPQKELVLLPVEDLAERKTWLFIWATPARLHLAIDVIDMWGFYYRNIAYVWRKATIDGIPVSDKQGTVCTYTKTQWIELLLLATTLKTGRMSPIKSMSHPSEIIAPREKHSRKPDIFRKLIQEQLGDLPRIELFATQKTIGWDAWGAGLK